MFYMFEDLRLAQAAKWSGESPSDDLRLTQAPHRIRSVTTSLWSWRAACWNFLLNKILAPWRGALLSYTSIIHYICTHYSKQGELICLFFLPFEVCFNRSGSSFFMSSKRVTRNVRRWLRYNWEQQSRTIAGVFPYRYTCRLFDRSRQKEKLGDRHSCPNFAIY